VRAAALVEAEDVLVEGCGREGAGGGGRGQLHENCRMWKTVGQ
jgi:hypothetical protein